MSVSNHEILRGGFQNSVFFFSMDIALQYSVTGYMLFGEKVRLGGIPKIYVGMSPLFREGVVLWKCNPHRRVKGHVQKYCAIFLSVFI